MYMYLAVWELRVEEGVIALHESGTPYNSHAMAVYRNEDPGVIVGHVLATGTFKTMPLLDQARAGKAMPAHCSLLLLLLLTASTS